jgi:twitching motility protein PilT
MTARCNVSQQPLPSSGDPAGAKPAGELSRVDKFLVAGIDNQATTIYMFPGACITYRIGNKLLKVPNSILSAAQTMAITNEILPGTMLEENTPQSRKYFLDHIKSADFSYSVHGVARFRVHVFRQRGSLGLCIRVIPQEIPDLNKYDLPQDFFQLIKQLKGGLYVVHGKARSGKSSLLAAIVQHINNTQNRIIAVLEPTIQFSHKNNLSLVIQREIGSDMSNLPDGIQEALRQDQDIIFVDELTNSESFDRVMEAVLKGITVFTAIGTPEVEKTITSLLNFKPANRQLDLINDLMTHLRGLLATEISTDSAGKRSVQVRFHPANLLNGILLSRRTELEQKGSQRSMFTSIDSTSSVDQSWFDQD